YTVTLAALALSGFAAMGYEVLFARVIGLAFGSSTHSFTVMLMAFITGIALGSAIVGRRTVRRPLWWLAASQLGVVVALLAVTPLVARLPYVIARQRIVLLDAPNGFELDLLGKAGLCLAILLVPTTCLGFGFPLVARVQARSPQDIGARVGSTYAWNTVGNVLGAVLTSLLLLPALGLNGAFHANLALNAAAGVLLLLVAGEAARPRRVALAAAAAAVLALYAALGTGWSDSIRYAVRHLRLRSAADPGLDAAARASHPASSFTAWQAAFVRPPGSRTPYFFAEDAHTTVLAFGEKPGDIYLHVNGKADASSAATDLDTQLLLAHAPLLTVRDTASVLVIGYGSGITTGSVLRYPVERVDVVEISRGVLQADPLFAEANGGALADPRVHVYEDDGQSFLRTVPRTYDVIISEPSNPWIAGVGNLFTVEFFAAARDRLNPGGVFTCWFHTYEQSDENVALIVRTLTTVFPHALVFADADFGNGVAVASLAPLAPDFAAMETRFAAVRDDLARLKIPNLLAMLSHQRVSAAAARELVGPGPLNSVAHPRLEFAAPRAMFEHQASFLLEQLDPLINADVHDDALLLDRYLAFRRAAGRPVEPNELEAAAAYAAQIGGYGPT
ncbi:MAG: spermidine synthase, partial [Candidatus Binatia bacterium]